MKKIIIILAFTAFALGAFGQVSDVLIQDTIDLYIYPNNSKKITAAQLNTILTLLNANKLNKDSAAALYGTFWSPSGTHIYNTNYGAVYIDSLRLYPLPNKANRVGRIAVVQTNGDVEWAEPLSVWDTIQEELTGSPGASPYAGWLRDTTYNYMYPPTDSTSVLIGLTAGYTPSALLEVNGTLRVRDTSQFDEIVTFLDSTHFSNKVVVDSSLTVEYVNADTNYFMEMATTFGIPLFRMGIRQPDWDTVAYMGMGRNTTGTNNSIYSFINAEKTGYGYSSISVVAENNGPYIVMNNANVYTNSLRMDDARGVEISSNKAIELDGDVTIDSNLIVLGDITYEYRHLVAYTTGGSYTPNTVSNTEFKLVPGFSTTENDGFTFAGDTITILKAGDYYVTFGTVLQGANGSDWVFKCRKNGTAITSGNLALSTTGAGNYLAGEWFWYLPGLAVGDDISFSVTNEGGSDDPTFRSVKVFIEKKPE